MSALLQESRVLLAQTGLQDAQHHAHHATWPSMSQQCVKHCHHPQLPVKTLRQARPSGRLSSVLWDLFSPSLHLLGDLASCRHIYFQRLMISNQLNHLWLICYYHYDVDVCYLADLTHTLACHSYSGLSTDLIDPK